MTNDTRTADEIERDIEEERARMSGTINELQKKFSVEAIVSDLGAMFRGQGEVARSISQTIGRNPAAVALVGVGLAWLFLGQGARQLPLAPHIQPVTDRAATATRHRARNGTAGRVRTALKPASPSTPPFPRMPASPRRTATAIGSTKRGLPLTGSRVGREFVRLQRMVRPTMLPGSSDHSATVPMPWPGWYRKRPALSATPQLIWQNGFRRAPKGFRTRPGPACLRRAAQPMRRGSHRRMR